MCISDESYLKASVNTILLAAFTGTEPNNYVSSRLVQSERSGENRDLVNIEIPEAARIHSSSSSHVFEPFFFRPQWSSCVCSLVLLAVKSCTRNEFIVR